MAIATGVLCLILLAVAFLVPAAQQIPVCNLVVYVLFTLCFMHFASWLALIDPTRLVYYALWLLMAIGIAYAIYAWATTTYMNSLISIMITGIACLLVFVGLPDLFERELPGAAAGTVGRDGFRILHKL